MRLDEAQCFLAGWLRTSDVIHVSERQFSFDSDHKLSIVWLIVIAKHRLPTYSTWKRDVIGQTEF